MIIHKNYKLSDVTSFKVGGNANYFIELTGEKDLREAIKLARSEKLRIKPIGEGSNILVSDKGFNGIIVKFLTSKITFNKKINYIDVTTSAGTHWDDLVKKCVTYKLSGIELMSGIPGSCGAAPVQNIGAYGQELKEVFLRLWGFDTKKDKYVIFNKSDCEFEYRDSMFKKIENRDRYIICDITLRLHKKKKCDVSYSSLQEYLNKNQITNPSLADLRKAVLNIRTKKLENPRHAPNAGSYFKNPIISKKDFKILSKSYINIPHFDINNKKIKLYAGWLIEEAGWKGKKCGNAKVSSRNALQIINRNGKSNTNEIMLLTKNLKRDIFNKFGVKLEEEVQYIT